MIRRLRQICWRGFIKAERSDELRTLVPVPSGSFIRGCSKVIVRTGFVLGLISYSSMTQADFSYWYSGGVNQKEIKRAHLLSGPKNITGPKIPRRINSASIFTSKGDDFDNLVLSLASFPPACFKFSDPLSQIRASEMIYSVGLNRNNGFRHEE